MPSGRRGASFPTVTIRSHRLAALAFLSVAWLEIAAGLAADLNGTPLPAAPVVISAATILENRLYARPASPDHAAVIIRGEGFTVDFQGATLQGADPTKVPANHFKGIGIRNAAHDPVDARGNSWIPESPSPDKQVQKSKPDSGNILTGQATQALPPLPEVEHPDLPIPASEWRLPPDMPHGRDKIILDDWGPVVPKGWAE